MIFLPFRYKPDCDGRTDRRRTMANTAPCLASRGNQLLLVPSLENIFNVISIRRQRFELFCGQTDRQTDRQTTMLRPRDRVASRPKCWPRPRPWPRQVGVGLEHFCLGLVNLASKAEGDLRKKASLATNQEGPFLPPFLPLPSSSLPSLPLCLTSTPLFLPLSFLFSLSLPPFPLVPSP